MISVMRQRNFALLWSGGFISMVGDWMLFTALPLYIYQLTGSALATSVSFMARLVPGLLLGSLAGVFVDRWDRKRIMLISNLLMAASLLPLLVVRSAELVWIIYLSSFIRSTVSQFFGPAENALLPRLVGEDQLGPANALNALNNNLARLVGPPLGGLVVATTGLAGVIWIDAATFLVAAALIALVRVSGRVERADAGQPAAGATSAWARIWRELREGLALIRSQRALRVAFAIFALCSFGEGIMSVMFILWIARTLGGGAQEMGWFLSAQAIGGILGGLVVGRVATSLGYVRLLGISGILFGLIDLALFNYPRFFSGVGIGLGLMALVGVPGVGFSTAQNTLVQKNVADAFLGRVFGAYGTIGALFYLISTALAGLIGDAIGPIPLLTIQGGAYVAAGVFALVTLAGIGNQESGIGNRESGADGEAGSVRGASSG
jgi:Na+/melibiose symporter-like transporter